MFDTITLTSVRSRLPLHNRRALHASAEEEIDLAAEAAPLTLHALHSNRLALLLHLRPVTAPPLMSSSPRAPIPTPSPTAPRHGTDPSRPRRRARHRLRGLAPARRGAMRVTVAVGFAAAPRSCV